jgi:dihydropteroate synthase
MSEESRPDPAPNPFPSPRSSDGSSRSSSVSPAEAAVQAGATVINDVSADLWSVAADHGVGWIAMHLPADPAVMADHAHYVDVVGEVTDHLVAKASAARDAGVDEIWIDPGIGFAKTADHNLSLLRHLDRLVATGWPVAVGTSRKTFLGRLSAQGGDVPGPSDRLEGSLATAAWAIAAGVDLVRVHDVAPTVWAARLAAPAQPSLQERAGPRDNLAGASGARL